jgi:hypothetical protein
MTKPMYSRNAPGLYSLWMDWESSGADFENGLDGTVKKYQGISVGLIIANNATLEEVDSLYVEMQFDGKKYQWTDRAQEIHGLSREHLATCMTREEALAEIIEFLMKYFGTEIIATIPTEPDQKVQIGGHNVQFDIRMLGQLFEDLGFNVGIHHVVIDTTAAAFLTIGMHKSNDVFVFFGAEVRGKHNALDDARQALQAARGIKQIFQVGLEAMSNV